MNLPKPFLALLACLFTTFQLYSQRVNMDGYYINLKGDTVFGKFINYTEFNKSPASVVFQPSVSAKPVTLLPGQCIKFSVLHSDTYISYQGKRLANEVNYEAVLGKGRDVYKDVTVFLRELFNDGHYQLYELKDHKRTNFYIRADTISLRELYYKEYAEEGQVVESHVFRDQLFVSFRGKIEQNPDLKRQWENIKYNEGSLMSFFTIMATGKARKTKEKYPAQFFVGLGVSANMFSVSGDDPPQYSVASTYNTQVSPVLETGLKLFSQRNFGRLFFMVRLQAYQYKNSGTFTDNSGSKNTSTFKATLIGLPFSLGYKLINKTSTAISLSAGVSALYAFNNELTTVRENGSSIREPDYWFKLTYNFFGEAEVVWKKKTSFFTGYYIPALIGNYTLYSPLHSSIKFGLRYCIF